MVYKIKFVVFSVIILVLSVGVHAETHLSGALSGTLSADTYIVDAQIWVNEEDDLIIEAGSHFLFDGDLFFIVDGSLIAEGTEADSIIFEPNAGVQYWNGIHFGITSERPNRLSYVRISSGDFCGIFTEAAEMTLSHSRLSGNASLFGGAIFSLGTTFNIDNCSFEYNTSSHGAAIYAQLNSILQIRNSQFTGNVSELSAGAIQILLSEAAIDNCEFESNQAFSPAEGIGGAIHAEYATLTVTNSTFHMNSAGVVGGVISMVQSEGTVTRSLFHQNSSFGEGGVIALNSSDARFNNCTLDDNSSVDDGAAVHLSRQSSLDFHNNTVTANNGSSILFSELTSRPTYRYNNVYGNSGTLFAGNVPTGAGQISTVNSNGDPADQYFNIFEMPGYVNAASGDFSLLSTSALIDAGNPMTGFDPDGTLSDIGAYYLSQGPTLLSTTLTPQNPPIQIPANGGTFSFDVEIDNGFNNAFTNDYWITITEPNGIESEPIFLRNGSSIPGSTVITRPDVPYTVESTSPPGLYHLTAYAGSYPGLVAATDEFTFEKLEVLDDIAGAGLNVTDPGIARDYELLTAYPNPFNPTTTLAYKIEKNSSVRLTLYNSAGQTVRTLYDGFEVEGSHEYHLDATGLAAGIYLVELNTGSIRQVQRLILLK